MESSLTEYDNLVFVDVEATNATPYSGKMTEFGCVLFNEKSYHGVLWDAIPDPECPAKPLITGRTEYPHEPVFQGLRSWLKTNVPGRPVFVSDNPAYDFMWMAFYTDKYLGDQLFGHSGRRISDFWAGVNQNWSETQKWKRYRKTKHDHNPVNDALGNVEAFKTIIGMVEQIKAQPN